MVSTARGYYDEAISKYVQENHISYKELAKKYDLPNGMLSSLMQSKIINIGNSKYAVQFRSLLSELGIEERPPIRRSFAKSKKEKAKTLRTAPQIEEKFDLSARFMSAAKQVLPDDVFNVIISKMLLDQMRKAS